MLLGKLLSGGSSVARGCYRFAAKKRDLYEILGVSRTADPGDIKKAYYKLAQEHHPDKNSNPDSKDKFAQINNAYQVLSDKGKRKTYDQTGSTDQNPYAGFQNEDIFSQFRNGGFGGGRGRNASMNQEDMESIFQDLFGGGGGVGGGRKGRKRGNGGFEPEGSENIVVRIELQFTEAVNGASKTIDYRRRSTCGTCKGSRAKPGSKPQKCQSCQGTGYMTFQQGVMMMRMECQRCQGSGQIIGSPCTPCSGKGIETVRTQEEIKFPRGIDNGAQLKFKSKGHINGDLIIQVVVKSHPKFKREGNDAVTQQQISVVDAILGTEVLVKNIYGETKTIKIPAGTQNNEKIKLSKEGFYRLNSFEKGNQVVIVKIKIPKKLSSEEQSLYRQLKQLRGQ